MRVYKTRTFAAWARQEAIDDRALATAIEEVRQGLVDANLGGGVYKKWLAARGKGKRGGARSLLAFQAGAYAVFIHGFVKSEQATVSRQELTALKALARYYATLTPALWHRATSEGALIEVLTHAS